MNLPLENLELIPLLLKEIKELKKEVQNLKEQSQVEIDLSKSSNVMKYLNISKSTLSNMLKDGRLKEHVHYTKKLNNNKIQYMYIESAIKKIKAQK